MLLSLAIPMILTNISTPLLGLVDTAVLGHLDSEQYLAAVALGGLIFSFVFWGFGFLRMGTTGQTAQAFGENNQQQIFSILIRSIILALLISTTLILAAPLIADMSFKLLESSVLVEQSASEYFHIRIWSAPATLCQYVLMGWFLGRQNVRYPLLVMLITNLSNIFLDVYFVYHLKMQVEGVAMATVIAEYLGLIVGLVVTVKTIKRWKGRLNWQKIINLAQFKKLFVINSHLFVRTWCLIFAFAFFTTQAAKMGPVILAANAVLLNFQTFMSYALDGFAHAVEALVGNAIGAGNRLMLKQAVLTAVFWSLIVAVIFTLIYYYYGVQIINLLTNIGAVKSVAYDYLPFLIIMPSVSFVCYLMDGVFIGAMRTKAMRNTIIFSLLMVYIPVWYMTQGMGNKGLWLAMLTFMFARSISMLIVYKTKRLINISE